MKKILIVLSIMSCIESDGMDISQTSGKKEFESIQKVDGANISRNENHEMNFSKIINMEQLFQLIMKLPNPEFFYSVMVDHIIPPPVSQHSVFESISNLLPPLSVIDSDGCQWKVEVPMVETTWLEWISIFKDIHHERFHIPLLKLMINDFLNERVSNPYLGLDVKLQNVVNMFKCQSTLYSLRQHAVLCNKLEQFEEIFDRLVPEQIRTKSNSNMSTNIPKSPIKIKKRQAIEMLQNLYSTMQLDQIETKNIEGFYIPGVVRNWSRSERVTLWKNWISYTKQRADIRDLLNNEEANPDEVAQKYYIPILQFLNMETNWAKHYELMPVLMDILDEYRTFVDYEHNICLFNHQGKYDTSSPAYVALTDYVSVLSEDLMLRLSNIDSSDVSTSLMSYGLSVQDSSDVWLSCLEKFSLQTESKTLNNYYFPLIKFFASKMVKGDVFFGGGHMKFITVLQHVISSDIRDLHFGVLFGRGYSNTDYRQLTLPTIILECCERAEAIIDGNSKANVYDVLMFLDKITEISSKDVYLLGYDDALLKIYSRAELATVKSTIKNLLWDSANPNISQSQTYQAIRNKLTSRVKQKLNTLSQNNQPLH